MIRHKYFIKKVGGKWCLWVTKRGHDLGAAPFSKDRNLGRILTELRTIAAWVAGA